MTTRACRRGLGPYSTRRDGVISGRGWKRHFEDPIPLPRGRQLVTLEDAARYIQKLPKAEQQIEEWQTAVEVLILVAESNGGPTMMARIGVMRALNRNVERVFNPRSQRASLGKAQAEARPVKSRDFLRQLFELAEAVNHEGHFLAGFDCLVSRDFAGSDFADLRIPGGFKLSYKLLLGQAKSGRENGNDH
jgi:hypothetical protein